MAIHRVLIDREFPVLYLSTLKGPGKDDAPIKEISSFLDG